MQPKQMPPDTCSVEKATNVLNPSVSSIPFKSDAEARRTCHESRNQKRFRRRKQQTPRDMRQLAPKCNTKHKATRMNLTVKCACGAHTFTHARALYCLLRAPCQREQHAGTTQPVSSFLTLAQALENRARTPNIIRLL